MAIRFTPKYNEYANEIVRNYNRRVRSANKEAKIPKKYLPDTVSLRSLKKNFTTRKDLNRELENLKMFSRESVRQLYTVGDKTFTQYELDLVKKQKDPTIQYYQELYNLYEPKIEKGYYAEKARVALIQDTLEILRKDEENLTGEDVDIIKSAIDEYRRSYARRGGAYRGFLSEVEWVMTQVGVEKADRDRFFKKLESVDQDQFFRIYNQSDIIERVYELADSPTYGGMKLNASKEDARELIDTLLEEIDMIIEETKEQ